MRSVGMEAISKSQASRLCAKIDGRVQDFLTRPIEGDWPYLWLDATYVKLCDTGRLLDTMRPTDGSHRRRGGER